jgi:glycine C-acetyltransferase
MADLETQLKAAAGQRHKVIVSDGVFSMDGTIAQLDKICDLADRYGALVMIDECHATGFMGATGRGTHEHHGVMGRIDIITGTLGKALGGAMGGFTAARREVVETLRQKSRPYLFSNSLAPPVAAGSLKAIEIAERADDKRTRLTSLTRRFRDGMTKAGFDLLPGQTPIVPVMLYDAVNAQKMAAELDKRGVFVAGFFYPVVAEGKARIRTQMSSALADEDIAFAIDAFTDAGRAIGII